MKGAIAKALASLPLAAAAMTYPPYDLYPYLADGTDNPPLNYTKVCEPGRAGESNAAYVVLGTWFPRAYQAVSAAFSGDLTIPAYIDGLPVRKINEAAFIACTNLKSVKIPSTVREIGPRAFSDCWNLTNVTFASDSALATVGEGAFTNCTSLASIKFPKTLSRLGANCFHGCISLADVYFSGNAPRLVVPEAADKPVLGEMIFRNSGYCERFKVHISKNTCGWIAPYVKGVPEKWPVDFGYMQAYETVAEDVDEAPAEAAGFSVVIAEIAGGTTAVPDTWPSRFPAYAGKFGSDFAASLTKPTGKKDASGNALQVWQDYVAGTDPTDLNDVFRAMVDMDGGTPVVSWMPVLPAAEASKRTYTIFGRQSLFTGDWTPVQSGQEANYNFFKVRVMMK